MAVIELTNVRVITPSVASVDQVCIQLPTLRGIVPNNVLPWQTFSGRMYWSPCVIQTKDQLDIGSRFTFAHGTTRYLDVIITFAAAGNVYTCEVGMVQNVDNEI